MDNDATIKSINDAFKPIQLNLQYYCNDLSKNIRNNINKQFQEFADSIIKIYENYNQNLAEAFKVITQSMQLSLQNYDCSNLIDIMSNINLQANDEVELELNSDEVEFVNRVSPGSLRSCNEQQGKQFLTFERLISIITLILAILTFYSSNTSSNQTSEKDDKIIHLLETISYQLAEKEFQETSE